ncbi:MAG: hypothetical protein HY647_10170 [Acidobacteria bacterium]|nr:hypothetical protein [Acidobacteriota bacterium]
MRCRLLWGSVLLILFSWRTEAQQTPPPADGAEEGVASAVQQPAGRDKRRDPFRSLIIRQKKAEAPVRLPPGKRGLVIGQLQVQGIVRGINNEWVAVVDNKTQRSYFLREGDEVYSGVVKKITEDTIAFEEKLTDAFGRTSTREVVKQLPSD